MKMQILTGHNSQETAFLVQDYPYGFKLRCQIRYWLEYRHGHGFRFMSQTTNPKCPGLVWNKPKASTYSTLLVMYLDENGHVHWAGIHHGLIRAICELFYIDYQGADWQADQQAAYQTLLDAADAYAALKAKRTALANA